MIVSQPSGRWGPCCSQVPTGTISRGSAARMRGDLGGPHLLEPARGGRRAAREGESSRDDGRRAGGELPPAGRRRVAAGAGVPRRGAARWRAPWLREPRGTLISSLLGRRYRWLAAALRCGGRARGVAPRRGASRPRALVFARRRRARAARPRARRRATGRRSARAAARAADGARDARSTTSAVGSRARGARGARRAGRRRGRVRRARGTRSPTGRASMRRRARPRRPPGRVGGHAPRRDRHARRRRRASSRRRSWLTLYAAATARATRAVATALVCTPPRRPTA